MMAKRLLNLVIKRVCIQNCGLNSVCNKMIAGKQDFESVTYITYMLTTCSDLYMSLQHAIVYFSAFTTILAHSMHASVKNSFKTTRQTMGTATA